MAGRLRVISPRKARSVRVVATAVRKLVENIDPAAATRIDREATRLARKTIVKLDPHRVEAAVRRVAETIDVDGKGKMDTVAKAAVAKIGPERATRIAGAATRAIKRLVDRLDPDHVGQVIGDLVAQPELRSAQHTGDRVNLHCFPECRDALDAATWRNPRDLHGKNFASRPSTALLTTESLTGSLACRRAISWGRDRGNISPTDVEKTLMKSSTGRWVSGADFFDREKELELLEARVRDGNHMVMTGQRRMGKTSVLRELGRRLEQSGWVFLFADVEADRSEEDLIASLAKAVHPITPIRARLLRGMRRRLRRLVGRVDKVSAHQFAVRLRAGLDSGNWRRHGEDLIAHCAEHEHEQRVLIVIDEMPIFLARLLRQENGSRRVDEFLSWLRAIFQKVEGRDLALILSGSIGLAPLVERLGISDRINYLDPIRLGPWNLEVSVRCFETLTRSYPPIR